VLLDDFHGADSAFVGRLQQKRKYLFFFFFFFSKQLYSGESLTFSAGCF
jgi:hypothetical protein